MYIKGDVGYVTGGSGYWEPLRGGSALEGVKV